MSASSLSPHLRKLGRAGYITGPKADLRRIAVAHVTQTKAGRRALAAYTAALRELRGGPAHSPRDEVL